MEQLDLITLIVQRGEADKVVKAAIEAGAQGATIYFARGTGVRQKIGVFGSIIQPEKEVVLIVTHSEETDKVFNAACLAGKLDILGKGFAFTQKIDRAVGFVEMQK